MFTQAERIRYLRKRVVGMTQQQFSREIKVSRVALGNWEAGTVATILPENAAKIARATGAEVEWIVNGEGETPPAKFPLSGGSSRSARADRLSKGSRRSPAPHETPDRPSDREAAMTAALDAAFLLLLNRAPTEAERSLLLKTSGALFEAREVLRNFQNRLDGHQIPSAIQDRINAIAFERE